MKGCLILLAIFGLTSSSFATPPSVKGLTIRDLPSFPIQVLRRGISPAFYASLRVSPLEGWIMARGLFCGSKLYGTRIIRSDLGGDYDKLALQLANEASISGYFSLDSQMHVKAALLHLLVYKASDSVVVVSFVNIDTAGGNQQLYYGCARTLVSKGGDKWTEAIGDDSGKGMVILAAGLKDPWMDIKKLEIVGN